MDEESAGKSEPCQSSSAGPQDGLIDFGSYSIEQLRELQFSVDRETFPQNFSNLLAALKQKEAAQTGQPVPQSLGYAGLFSSRAGILGWLLAKARRSPVYGAGAIELGAAHILLR